jgi:hypothetical protein
MDGLNLDRVGRATVLIALGLGIASAMVSAFFRTANFADGSLYLFAALTPDPWGVLWFNFPLRASVFVFEIVPSWLAVRLTGDAQAGLVVYSLIRGSWPLLSLLATMALEERGSSLSRMAAASIVIFALPTTFFPTEVFVTHAFFWPFMAVLVRRTEPSVALVAAFALPVAFSHEAGVLLILSAALWSALVRQPLRIQAALATIVIVWFAVSQMAPPPTAEIAHVMATNRKNFLVPRGLLNRVSLAVLAAIVTFLLLWAGRWRGARTTLFGCLSAGVAAAVFVYVGMLLSSPEPLSDPRYTLRTVMFYAMAGVMAVITTHALVERLRPDLLNRARLLLWGQRTLLTCIVGLAFIVTALGQTVEATVFLRQWVRLDRIVAGPAPSADELPRYLTLLVAGQEPVEGRSEQPGSAWSTSWEWAMPFHSLTVKGPLVGSFIIVPSVRRTFVPIDCPRLRSLDAEATRVPADRLALLQSYFCDPSLVHVHH